MCQAEHKLHPQVKKKKSTITETKREIRGERMKTWWKSEGGETSRCRERCWKKVGLMGSWIKVSEVEYVANISRPLTHSNVLLQLSIIHATGNESACHPFSLISILQPFDRRNQRALAPTETLWPWASLYVCVKCVLSVCVGVSTSACASVCHPALWCAPVDELDHIKTNDKFNGFHRRCCRCSNWVKWLVPLLQTCISDTISLSLSLSFFVRTSDNPAFMCLTEPVVQRWKKVVESLCDHNNTV